MDEEERKSKLKAGKDALLAYQKKKGRKSKKKKTLLDDDYSLASESSFSEPPSFVDSLPLSLSTSIDTSGIGQSPLSNSTSPCNDDGDASVRAVTKNGPEVAHVLSLASTENLTSDDYRSEMLAGRSPNAIDSSVTNNSLLHSLDASVSGESDLANNSLPTRANGVYDTSAELAEKVAKLEGERDELEAELRALRDSQQTAFEKGQQMMADHYQSQLVQAESALQSREAETERLRQSHVAELDRVARQQLQLREEELKARDRKHAAHVARLTEQLSRQENVAGSFRVEDGEREAERICQIKEKLKEMYQEEKEQLLLSHQQEKQLLVQEYERQKELVRLECQRTLEENQRKLENLANQQMAQVHAQYVAAHKQVTDANDSLEAQVNCLTTEVAGLRAVSERLEREKKTAVDKLDEMSHSHSMEIQSMKHDSADLEQRVLDWKSKADSLTARLEQSNHDEAMREEYEKKIEAQRAAIETLESQIKRMKNDHTQAMERREESIKTVYSAKLSSKQSTIEELENQVRCLERQHAQDLAGLKEQHRAELSAVVSRHSSELSLLEDSMSEDRSSKASLEFAEAHMKEMQQQLNAYRNQETNHRAEVEATKKQHLQEMEDLREALETQHSRRFEGIERTHTEALQLLQKQLTGLRSRLEAQETSHDQVVESELEKLRCALQADFEKQLKLAEVVHIQVQEEMRRDHEKELAEAREDARHPQQSEMETLREELRAEKTKEVEELRAENQTALIRLKASLTATGEEALTETRRRIIDLEQQLCDAEGTTKENRKLQEQCQKFQTELTARQVDLSIAESALKEERKALVDSRAKVEELSEVAIQLQRSEQSLSEEMSSEREHLNQLLQEKEDELATHVAHNQKLQAQVTDLSSELEDERERVQTDIENSQREVSELSEQQSSQLQAVRLQLQSAKQKYANLMEEWSKKEEDTLALKSELATTRKNLAECESRWAAKYAELASQTSQEIDSLNQRLVRSTSPLANLSRVLQEARGRVSSLENQDRQQKETIAELSDRNRALSGQLASAKEAKAVAKRRLAESLEELGRLQSVQREGECLEAEAEELQSRLQSLEGEHRMVCTERSELKDQVELLQTQLPSLSSEVRSLKTATEDQEKVIADLKAQLTAREDEFVQAKKEFAQKLARAELKQQSLQDKMRESKKASEALSSVVNRKGDLERSLSRARQSLMDKLRAKSHLEKELNFQRVELERRQSEKRRLDELLMEKSRFEQELRSQKEQLATELETIETKLKMREPELSGEQNDSAQSARERDGLFLLSEYVTAQPPEEEDSQQTNTLFDKNSNSLDSLESEH